MAAKTSDGICVNVGFGTSQAWPYGLMDKALVFGTKDCRFAWLPRMSNPTFSANQEENMRHTSEAAPGIELKASRARRQHHATRPGSHYQ